MFLKKSYSLWSFIILFLILFSYCTKYDSTKKYNALIEAYLKYWNTGQFDSIKDVLHPYFELRMTPKYEPEKGIDLFMENVMKWRIAYPDFTIVIDETVYGEDSMACRWTITATNTGEGWHPPTGKSIRVSGMSIIHFSDGKIKDEWIASNKGYWLQQLGFKLVSPFQE